MYKEKHDDSIIIGINSNIRKSYKQRKGQKYLQFIHKIHKEYKTTYAYSIANHTQRKC